MNRWRENEEKDLIEQLFQRSKREEIRTLGIYGHGASGKSTFAQELSSSRFYYSKFTRNRSKIITSERHLVVPKQAPDQKVTACLPVAHELASLQIFALQAGMDILTIDEPWRLARSCLRRKANSYCWRDVRGFLPKELFDKTICFSRMRRPN